MWSGLLNPHSGSYDLHHCWKSKDRYIKMSATNQQTSTERLPPCNLCMISINEVSGITEKCYRARRLVIVKFRSHCLSPVLLYFPTWLFNVPYSVRFVWVYSVLNSVWEMLWTNCVYCTNRRMRFSSLAPTSCHLKISVLVFCGLVMMLLVCGLLLVLLSMVLSVSRPSE